MNLQDTKNKLDKLGIGLRPILFSTPMVEAIIIGDKNQTRRECAKPIGADANYSTVKNFVDHWGNKPCKYGKEGDILWVRETWGKPFKLHLINDFFYKANPDNCQDISTKLGFKWKPGIHMPFEAARIFLRLKSIAVERLNDISHADAIAEGIKKSNTNESDGPIIYKDYMDKSYFFERPDYSFFSLWESINGKNSLDSNPWVWVIKFERINLTDIYV